MCDLWLSHIHKGELNEVVFLDIRKAFDSIKHKILLKKLKNQFGICDNELKWFLSYLNNRMQVCYVNGQTSAPKIIVNGIPINENVRSYALKLFSRVLLVGAHNS